MTHSRRTRAAIAFVVFAMICGLSQLSVLPPARGDEATDRVERTIEGMHHAFAELGEMVGGLSAEQKKKADALEKQIADKLRADPAKADAGPAFKQEVMRQFRTILTPEQQKKFDAQMKESDARVSSLVTANRLKQIGRACMMYANENKGSLPPDLGTVFPYYLPDPNGFLAGQSPTAVPDDLKKRDEKAQAKWVTQNTDFAYTKPGKKLTDLRMGFVLAYVRPAVATTGNSFLRVDGAVISLDAEKSAKVLAELKDGKNPPPSLDNK